MELTLLLLAHLKINMKKIAFITLGLIIFIVGYFVIKRYTRTSASYTPTPTEIEVFDYTQYLPYSNEKFSIIWNSQANQLEIIISKPYVENSTEALNWLSDHNINNLPPSMLKITKK